MPRAHGAKAASNAATDPRFRARPTFNRRGAPFWGSHRAHNRWNRPKCGGGLSREIQPPLIHARICRVGAYLQVAEPESVSERGALEVLPPRVDGGNPEDGTAEGEPPTAARFTTGPVITTGLPQGQPLAATEQWASWLR
jgi:hypothetical protein